MKKFLHSLLVLFMGITSTAFAQQEATTVEAWNGGDLKVELGLGEKKTLMYTAPENGRLYIYAKTQIGNIPVNIKGGLWLDGQYAENDTLQEAGVYDVHGVYAWIKVYRDEHVRFTLTAAEEVDDEKIELTEFDLQSLFFTQTEGSQNDPIVLTVGDTVTLPTFHHESTDIYDNGYETYCKFTAPSTGFANIVCEEYEIFYDEEEGFDTEDLKSVIESTTAKYHHEFTVEAGKTYIVMVPNRRPAEVTFKMSDKQLGTSINLPYEISEFPKTLNLVEGDNYYKFDYDLMGENTIMEVSVAEGWNGKITYYEANAWGGEESDEITPDTVMGKAAIFRKNVETKLISSDSEALIINFNMKKIASLNEAATITLRKPEAGESFETAVTAKFGENAFQTSSLGDIWAVYTAEKEAEYSFAVKGATLKHVFFNLGEERMVGNNIYRLAEGDKVYLCVAATQENSTLTISGKEISDGDYCDRPKYFELEQELQLVGRGRDFFYSFTAEKDGFAIFNITDWTLHFRDNCDTYEPLNVTYTTEEVRLDGKPKEGYEYNFEMRYTYKLPVTAGEDYIVILQAATEDEEFAITTGFEEAATGELCSNAVAIESLSDTINIDYAFEKIKWFKYTADQDGFYAIKAKLGFAANMTTKVGDCDAAEINAGNDNTAKNAYMGGYKAAKVYLAEGSTVYIYTKTGSENDETEFSARFYLSVSYAGEARPGEDAAVAIQAKANTEYTILKNDADGYEQWYTYTIPAEKEAVFALSTVVKYLTNNFSFYREDKTTTMSTGKGDYTQENITNEKNETIGKRITFAAADEARTIFFKLGTVNAKFYPDPVVWQIICDDNTGIEVEEVAPEAAVIYDLMGRRVENPGKGIYIINGVKRVIK